MNERLTKNNGTYSTGKPKQYSYKHYNEESFYSDFSDAIDRLGKIEDALFDAEGKEIISLEALALLAEAKHEGRILILEKHIIPDGAEAWAIWNDKASKGVVSHHTNPYRMYFLSADGGFAFSNASVGLYVFLTEDEVVRTLESHKR